MFAYILYMPVHTKYVVYHDQYQIQLQFLTSYAPGWIHWVAQTGHGRYMMKNVPSANFERNTKRSHLLSAKRCNETSFSWCPIRTKWRFVEINQ